jgi:hypothetical protein
MVAGEQRYGERISRIFFAKRVGANKLQKFIRIDWCKAAILHYPCLLHHIFNKRICTDNLVPLPEPIAFRGAEDLEDAVLNPWRE